MSKAFCPIEGTVVAISGQKVTIKTPAGGLVVINVPPPRTERKDK